MNKSHVNDHFPEVKFKLKSSSYNLEIILIALTTVLFTSE